MRGALAVPLILCLVAEDIAGETADTAAAIQGGRQIEARVWKHDTGRRLGSDSALHGEVHAFMMRNMLDGVTRDE